MAKQQLEILLDMSESISPVVREILGKNPKVSEQDVLRRYLILIPSYLPDDNFLTVLSLVYSYESMKSMKPQKIKMIR